MHPVLIELYTDNTLPLNSQDYIAAYAYVPTAIQNGGDPGMTDGDKLNELGQYYANL